MKCIHCQNELPDGSKFCAVCGTMQTENQSTVPNNEQTENTAGTSTAPAQSKTTAVLALVFAFLVPVVGLILGIIGLKKYKASQTSAETAANYGKYRTQCIIAIAISILIWVISIASSVSLFSSVNDKPSAPTEKATVSAAEQKEDETAKAVSPKSCIKNPKDVLKRVKPVFKKYGYDLELWTVTNDNADIFTAETANEILLYDSKGNLSVNLDKGGSSHGLFILNNSIQIHCPPEEEDFALELLDAVFKDVTIDGEALSTYVTNEYDDAEKYNGAAQWENGGIRYMVAFQSNHILIMMTFV